MLEFGTDNAEINESCKLPPFVLSMQDTPDNELIITIALPQIENNNVKTERISECDNPRLKEILSAAQPVHEDMERISMRYGLNGIFYINAAMKATRIRIRQRSFAESIW